MRFGIHTLDEFDVSGKTVLCRLDLNQPVDRATGTLKSTARIEACVPTVRELSDKGAKLVLLAHQGSDIEYKNFYCTRPHADVLSRLLERPVQWIDDVCGPAAREKIRALQNGEILLLDNVRFVSEEQTLFELKLRLTHEQQAKTLLVEKLAPLADLYVCDAFAAAHRDQPSLSVTPNCFAAVTLSPPPTTVYAAVSASASNTAFVPSPVSGCSKMPIGPLTNTVFAARMRSRYNAAVRLPMSTAQISAGTAPTAHSRRVPPSTYARSAGRMIRSAYRA